MTSTADQRKHERVPVSMNVERSGSDRPVGFGYALNVSERGVAIDARALNSEEEVPTPGTELRLRFKLPGGTLVVTAWGRVVRIEPATEPGGGPLIGLEFLSLAPEFSLEIQRFVNRARHRV